VNLELMKAGYPPIGIKFTDRAACYDAFDAYHVKHDLSAMEGLFAGYINAAPDTYFDSRLIEYHQRFVLEQLNEAGGSYPSAFFYLDRLTNLSYNQANHR